jgi:hypothetical protein
MQKALDEATEAISKGKVAIKAAHKTVEKAEATGQPMHVYVVCVYSTHVHCRSNARTLSFTIPLRTKQPWRPPKSWGG